MLNHKNVVRLEGVYETENSVYIMFEILKGGTMLNFYQDKDRKTKLKGVMKGILSGLKYLHKKCIIHRDIKL